MEFNAIIVRKYQNFIKCIEWDVFSGGTSVSLFTEQI